MICLFFVTWYSIPWHSGYAFIFCKFWGLYSWEILVVFCVFKKALQCFEHIWCLGSCVSLNDPSYIAWTCLRTYQLWNRWDTLLLWFFWRMFFKGSDVPSAAALRIRGGWKCPPFFLNLGSLWYFDTQTTFSKHGTFYIQLFQVPKHRHEGFLML